MWQKYKDIDGDSSVEAYKVDLTARNIIVRFSNGKCREYLYEERKIGEQHYKNMINYAELGDGLGSYIQNYVRNGYSSKG
ncbi:MAG TPA: hypothetical protein DCP90_07875 [Clostridiales bacterium]|nr:MAG: hypothetical protein A2Y22_06070 [Clostridiales bacterium GWD2_32_59]HAN10517.1 hypothetical protein [Clostridiales bacterium]